MKEILKKLARHGLTALGGVGMATDGNVEQLAGALSFLIGIAMSLYEARKTKPIADPAATSVAVKIIPLLVTCALLGSGCASVAPGHDPVVVRAEQTRSIAASTFAAFVKLEHYNRPALRAISSDFARIADQVRSKSDGWIQSLTRVLAGYKASRNPENRASLTAALSTLDAAMREVELHTAIAAQHRIAP